jgi:hypothetical protein
MAKRVSLFLSRANPSSLCPTPLVACLGIHLPQDLKEHYLRHNGGRPRPGFFHKDGEAYGVGEFLAMNTGSVKSDTFGNIMFYQHDCYEDDRHVLFLAPSLKEFMNSLAELNAS